MTLLNTYQLCKELIANNLQLKGVQANSDEGLTTLANKILDINTTQQNNKYATIIFHCDIRIPNNFPYQNELNELEFCLIGNNIEQTIKYSDLIHNEYDFHNIKLGQYILYSPNAMILFADKNNISLTSNSIFIKNISLRDTQDSYIYFEIEYQIM